MHFSGKTHRTFFEVLEKTFIFFMEVPSIKIKRVMTKTKLVPIFLAAKKCENHPLITTPIENDRYHFTIYFIYVLVICPISLTGLKCLVLKKFELEVKRAFLQVCKKLPSLKITQKL